MLDQPGQHASIWAPVYSRQALCRAVMAFSGSIQNQPHDVGQDGKRYRLTGRQERFCRVFAEGRIKLVDAYLQAGYAAATPSRKTVREHASRLLSQPKIRQRVAELHKKVLATDEALSVGIRRFVQARLEKLANNAKTDMKRIKALEMLGRMRGVQMFVSEGRVR